MSQVLFSVVSFIVALFLREIENLKIKTGEKEKNFKIVSVVLRGSKYSVSQFCCLFNFIN